MTGLEVLVLHGAPGSGKTTLGRAITERLIAANLATGMIDLDALSLVHPSPGRSFSRGNFARCGRTTAAVPGISRPTLRLAPHLTQRSCRAAPSGINEGPRRANLAVIEARMSARPGTRVILRRWTSDDVELVDFVLELIWLHVPTGAS